MGELYMDDSGNEEDLGIVICAILFFGVVTNYKMEVDN